MTRPDREIERGEGKNKGLCEDFHLNKGGFLNQKHDESMMDIWLQILYMKMCLSLNKDCFCIATFPIQLLRLEQFRIDRNKI